MDKEYANYDLLDRMIANEKKAKSWTVFWISLLCILGGLVIWMAIRMNRQNKELNDKFEIIQAQNETLRSQRDTISDKNALIKSLEEDCNRDKTRMSDSFKVAVTAALTSIAKAEETNTTTNQQTDQSALATAKENTIKRLDAKIIEINRVFQKDKLRIFIQYNNSADLGKINNLINYFKAGEDYVVPPPEMVQSKFTYLMKCYNYENAAQEQKVLDAIAKFLSVKTDNIRVTHETRAGMHPTIEVWVGSPDFVPPVKKFVQMQMQPKS